jgi:polyisoprenoid-binding protein YceI
MKAVQFLSMTGVLTASLIATAGAQYQPGTYSVDSMHSKVGFEIPHLVISTVEGKFTQFEGKLELAEKFQASQVEAKIDLKSIDTGVAKRDDHLRSPDFFDVKKHPNMTFKSTAIEGEPASFKLTGDLSLHGVTRKVTFNGKYLGSVVDGYGNEKAAFQAKAVINRKDFGLTWSNMVEAGPVVGDEVTIDLRIQAGRPAVAKKQASAK